MSQNVKPIPDGYRTVTPHIVVSPASEAIAFYQQAFGAQELARMEGPGGKIMHAEIRIGDSIVMLADEVPEMGTKGPRTLGGTAGGLMLYVTDCDATFQQAVTAGAKVVMPPTDMFWGDRYGKLLDPFGHQWSLGTHIEDVAPEEMERRMKEWEAKQGQGG